MRVLKPDGTPHTVHEAEILFFSSCRNTIYVHTSEGEFIYPISLSDLMTAYRPAGYDRLDRSNVVNTNRISSYEEERKVVYFDQNPGPYATVSEANENKIRNLLSHRKKGSQ